MTRQIPIRFKGEGSGVDDLTWGQRAVWRVMLGNSSLPVGGVVPVEDGATVEEIARVLEFIMCRHQSLRTRLPVDDAGQPRQMVSDSGETTLDVIDAADDDDPAEVAESLHSRYAQTPYDHVRQWPARMAVVRHRGVPTHVVAVYQHIALDAYGFEALMADLVNLDRATGRQLAPVAGVQSLELARIQRGESARRQSAASLRQWERHLRAIPARRFLGGDERAPRFWEVSFNSPAAYLAMRRIAVRAELHTGPILLAAYAAVLTRLTGINPGVIRTLVSNRFRPGFAASVSPLAQSALCVIDTTGTFDEVAVRAWKSLLDAGKHAYYDPVELWALIDRVNQERGEKVDLDCYYNDRRGSMAQAPIAVAPPAQAILDALPLGRLRWEPKRDDPNSACFLHINGVPDTLDYTLRVDTHYVSPVDLEAMARDLEVVLVDAAVEPTLPACDPSRAIHTRHAEAKQG